MAFAYKVGDQWIEISGPFTIGEGENALQYPADWPFRASEDERDAAGIFEIVEPESPPANVRTLGSELAGEDAPERVWVTEAFDLDDLRADMANRANQDAGAFRRRFITDIPGQQATYLAKEVEAKAWAPGADDAGFPYLATEAAETGRTIAEIVALVLATATVWRALDAKIEGKRRGAAVAIAAAETADEIIAAAAVNWDALLA